MANSDKIMPGSRDALMADETSRARHQFESEGMAHVADTVVRRAFDVATKMAMNGIDAQAIHKAASAAARDAFLMGLHFGVEKAQEAETDLLLSRPAGETP